MVQQNSNPNQQESNEHTNEMIGSDNTPRQRKVMAWRLGHNFDENQAPFSLNGRYSIYTLKKTLGKGGFGITYLAEDKSGKLVVIKTLNETVKAHPHFKKFKNDFSQEAVELARYNHPHIVKVIEIININQEIHGKEQDVPCIVMEYIKGWNLSELISHRHKPLKPDEAIRYTKQIGKALIEVHQKDLLHRDVKPANIIIRSEQKSAVLIDFGIARPFRPNERGSMTSFNSEGYTPIEQYQNDGNHGYHSDVHALAATLYFMLTGKSPESAEARIRTKKDKLIPPKELNPGITDEVNEAILKGMERYPEDRSRTIEEWLNLFSNNFEESNPNNSDSLNEDNSDTLNPPDNSDTLNPDNSDTQSAALITSAVSGGIYGLLTLPLLNLIFSSWFSFSLWLLIMGFLAITQFLGLLNFLSAKTRKYLGLGVTIIALIVGIKEFFNQPLLTVIILLLFSIILSTLLMLTLLNQHLIGLNRR
ncbi:serine/threonine-protein kinase [Nostoc sp. FACHB-110]|uniref:serine/threonine protein kinase n=1 Tax=Nostoc sp. FACHB-110 TaxID=2692834 RepID=UPI0016861B77|nr:serine/threonine-protein kinase [Nostoc sp. FACHB-110]MBD2439975.1 serine/threonine protein kinase [Nostoc sp. FACHB-110]